jgi:phosphoribosyl-AMP cyclohydrolase
VVILQQRLIGHPAGKTPAGIRKYKRVTLASGETAGPFAPRFDAAGLLTAVAVDAASGEVLMVAHMDAEALAKTRETGLAHFHSRSRGRLWMKGESSGHILRVVEIRVDCDQDALVLRVEAAGPACHTGERSCFYRVLEDDQLAIATS